MPSTGGERAEDEALLAALSPSAAETEMLAFVVDSGLRDALLFMLLRAPVGAHVCVQVSEHMDKSDAFVGARLDDLLASAFIDATLHVKATGGPWKFALFCQARPRLQRMYEGDSVLDNLIEYFNKGLIRFQPAHVSRRIHAS